MNERIKELANQCHHQYSEHNIDLEKFAELIVRECIDIVERHGSMIGVDYIKEHFEIE